MLFPVNDEVRNYLSEAVKYAWQIGKEDQLLQCLHRLGHGHYNNGHEYICILYKDFAPLSFVFDYFQLKDILFDENGTIILKSTARSFSNGGLIYSGPLPNGGENTDASTFTVHINEHTGWSINT